MQELGVTWSDIRIRGSPARIIHSSDKQETDRRQRRHLKKSLGLSTRMNETRVSQVPTNVILVLDEVYLCGFC